MLIAIFCSPTLFSTNFLQTLGRNWKFKVNMDSPANASDTVNETGTAFGGAHLDSSGSSRGVRGRAKLTTPAGARRARERAERLVQDAKRLRDEADQFDNVRKMDAAASAREKAKDRQAKKDARAPLAARPLTNAMFVQPAFKREEDDAQTSSKRAKRDESNERVTNDRLQVGNSIPGALVFSDQLVV
jgi:hypothetical protein